MAAADPSAGRTVELDGRVMGSELRVVALDPADGALDDAIDLLDALEARWSRFVPDSELARLYASPGRPVEVSAPTLRLVELMQHGHHVTAGRFDPSVLPLLVAHGGGDARTVPHRPTVLPAGPLRWGAMGEVVVDRPAGTVTLPAGVVLDPGGIGKGLAADLLVAHLLGRGVRGCLVSIGGDLSMGGAGPHDGGWTISVEHPDEPLMELTRVVVSGGGVATSTTTSRCWDHDGVRHHHTIDPRRGAPAVSDLRSVTVVARTGWFAEVLATAVLVAGRAEGLELLDREGASGVLLGDDDTVVTTPDLAALRLCSVVGAR